MNIGRVYTSPTFIARGIDQSRRGIDASDKYCKGAHPTNIHHEGYRPLDRGYRGTQSMLEGCTPLQHSSRGVWTTRQGGIGAHNQSWKGVHPSDIHHEGYRILDRGYGDKQ